ncbi:MAG: LuxR C-terminal-related transcriptional regulator [Anaerolineae bacterium]|nr:LuxR C-terminal-related transcriptional regulator [Anaerolineae bacterium]
MEKLVLQTKLYIPPARVADLVPRPRLIERLNEGLHRTPSVALISAPAGFGKTTLVSSWIYDLRFTIDDLGAASQEKIVNPRLSDNRQSKIVNQVAWLSLDEGDNDPTRFLTYLVAALQTIAPTIGEGVLGMFQSSQPPPTESTLTALLNEIITVPDGFVLVLDDYHVIEAKPVDSALTFLIEHLPPQMHLVITTREDPPLPLARLRARGQLTELRAADLRFTPGEAATFLNGVMDLDLSAEEVTSLEGRTEGWIAGLQLAALSMRGRADVAGFIQAFAGDNRYIVDYLVEEVLQRQPEPVRRFLLETSILDRLSGPLCDAVVGDLRLEIYSQSPISNLKSQAMLEQLERANLFVIPLDDRRQWYRYHHLFADVLRAHLREEQPDQVSLLHRRASEWYEQNGLAAEAIRHALAAEDFGRAAHLIERAVPEMRRSRQEATLLGWLQSLPDELFRSRPVLSVHYAGTLLQSGQLEGVEARLRDAERWLDPTADRGEMVVVDEADFRGLPGSVAIYHAGIALVRGDVAGTVTYAQRALNLVPEADHLGRGAAAALLGLAYWTSGDLETAYQTYAEGMAGVQRAGHLSDALGCAIALADMRLAQGRLREAMSIYERGLKLATEQGTLALAVRGAADMYVGMSQLHRERDDLNAATQHLLRSKELGEFAGLPQNRYRWCVAMARIREVQGDLDGALDLLQEAERLYMSDFFPNVRPITALKTRVWLAQGRLGEALDWVREQGLSAQDDLSYLREFEHITLARVLLARYKSDHTDRSIREVIGLLARLLQAAEDGGRRGSAIEILVVQALAHQARGDIPTALLPLQQALTLAEPEGYVRIFVDEGSPMAQLLREAAARGIMPDYTGKLLAAFEPEPQKHVVEPPIPTTPAVQSLIEPLSQRELEVLRLFKTELSGPEIADELVIGLSTLRTHTKSIYSKLNVNSRRAAVNRAEELGLI